MNITIFGFVWKGPGEVGFGVPASAGGVYQIPTRILVWPTEARTPNLEGPHLLDHQSESRPSTPQYGTEGEIQSEVFAPKHVSKFDLAQGQT